MFEHSQLQIVRLYFLKRTELFTKKCTKNIRLTSMADLYPRSSSFGQNNSIYLWSRLRAISFLLSKARTISCCRLCANLLFSLFFILISSVFLFHFDSSCCPRSIYYELRHHIFFRLVTVRYNVRRKKAQKVIVRSLRDVASVEKCWNFKVFTWDCIYVITL